MSVLSYIKKLIEKKANESSKRFIALTITVLVIYATLRFTTTDNIVLILGELLSFILVLMGVAVWENTKNKSE